MQSTTTSKTKKPKANGAAAPEAPKSFEENGFQFGNVGFEKVIEAAMEQLGDAIKYQMLLNEATPRRKWLAFGLSMLAAFGAGYVIGVVASYLVAGILALGGSTFWAFLIMVLSVMLSLYTGIKLGQKVGIYVLSGQIDKDLKAVKQKAMRLFDGFKKKAAVAA